MKKLTVCFFAGALCATSLQMQAQPHEISIDIAQQFQTIAGFGAADCWTADFVGKYWATDKKEQIARWLFSQEIPTSGAAKGIGLSMWRVNIGAGTAEQGSESHLDPYRRTECFLTADGTYDWTKQAGQQFFIQKAKEYGCEHLIAFSNSPPVYWTQNGKGYAKSGSVSNLQTDKYDEFAGFLADVAQHFADSGYNFSYISPVNEPQYEWTDTAQEGSPWQNSQIKQIVTELNAAIVERNLNSKILVTEAGSYDYLYSSPNSHANKSAGNQIMFFNPSSAAYIGNLPSVAPAIAAHGYWTYGTTATTVNVRRQVKNAVSNYGIDVFQSEWSMLADAPTDGFTSYEASTAYGDIGLFLARMIYADFVEAGASSWSFWTAMDMERYSQKNRFMLIALRPGGNWYLPPTMSGDIYARPNLWALGNYSLFVRPNYRRIALVGAQDYNGLLGTAYIAPDSSKIVAVYVNQFSTSQTVKTAFVNLAGKRIAQQNMYFSNGTNALRQYSTASQQIYSPEGEVSFPARSVITMVYDLENIENNGTENLYTMPENAENAPVYDITGRYVGTGQTLPYLKAGIYFINGKKIIKN